MRFSVIMPVYYADKPIFFEQALRSITVEQTRKPNEVIIVKDGTVSDAIDTIILSYSKRLYTSLYVVNLKRNRGLANALNEGLKTCSYEWVARMDSDDIALPDRFEKQIAYLETHPEVEMLGGWIEEFDDLSYRKTLRKVPLHHEEIVSYMKRRCAFNHMTVMYKKSNVMDAGGYRPGRMEDFELWLRMMVNGTRFANLDSVLVRVRAGEEMLTRRRGTDYAADEWKLAYRAWKIGAWRLPQAMQNAAVRSAIRLLPLPLMKKVYNRLRKVDEG